MAKKNHFDINMGLDMSSMTDLVTQVEKAAEPASGCHPAFRTE